MIIWTNFPTSSKASIDYIFTCIQLPWLPDIFLLSDKTFSAILPFRLQLYSCHNYVSK